MRKAGLVFSVLLLANLGLATGQELPKPLPENIPDARERLALADSQYPSARVCGQCHPNQYKQWSISSHAYAAVSPMFNKFEQTINNISRGTVNYFCVRCHASVGTALAEPRAIAWWDRSGAAQEGITCVTCHRVGEGYSKTNAARRITPGPIHEPVFGPFDSLGGLKAITNARENGILVTIDELDRPAVGDKKWIRMHQTAIQSDLITQAEFCEACHQVAVYPGIKLETVWEEWRASPAAKEGITCQKCHMSKNPGHDDGFEIGWAASVNGPILNGDGKYTCPDGKQFNDKRPLSDHTFAGPGYPISHPGLFPFRMDESPFTPQQWLTFDWRAGWGNEDFEGKAAGSPSPYTFPPEWQNPADRKKAWVIVQENLGRWKDREQQRLKLMEGASQLDGPYFDSPRTAGKTFSFHYTLKNMNKGHNLPSGSLGAQPELWLNVALIDPNGRNVWESGYVDKNGDVADFQSEEVGSRTIDPDYQLFSMQSKFLTTNLKGTDREMYLPINLDFDQDPFIRPGGAPTSILNHPPNARLEKRSIPPLGHRDAHYHIPGDKLKTPGTYKLVARLRGRTEPIYFMSFVSATTEMKRTENEWVTDTHAYAVEFEVR
jgi:nitrate/TMAO reductase-like tetraheme cytochrome c subunit